MSLKSEKRMSMDELMELNQSAEAEVIPEKVVVELPEEVLLEMRNTQAKMLKTIRQILNEMDAILAENSELKRKNLILEQERKLAETREKIEQDGRARERHIENIESRISRNIEELTEGINNLCGKAVLIVSGAILAAVLVSVCFLWLR